MRNPFKRRRDDAPGIDAKGLVRQQGLDKEQIAELLRTTPAAVEAFEDAYRTHKLGTNIDENDLFGMNSRQAAAMTHGDVDEWAKKVFGLEADGDYFIKTGTYSSKFDFRNVRVHDPKEIDELGEYLLFIHFQALQMASPLCRPCIYGVSTTNEWVVRRFISDMEMRPTIYNGLPLRTEYRVFVDCDTDTVLGIHPYWDPKVMKSKFDSASDPDSLHDAITYRAAEPELMRTYEANKDRVTALVAELLPNLDLAGQWSIDIMQDGDDLWLIDMALAENSAFYRETVPAALMRPSEEHWMPELPANEE